MNRQTIRVTTYVSTGYAWIEPSKSGRDYYYVSEKYGDRVGPYKGIVSTAELAGYLFPKLYPEEGV